MWKYRAVHNELWNKVFKSLSLEGLSWRLTFLRKTETKFIAKFLLLTTSRRVRISVFQGFSGMSVQKIIFFWEFPFQGMSNHQYRLNKIILNMQLGPIHADVLRLHLMILYNFIDNNFSWQKFIWLHIINKMDEMEHTQGNWHAKWHEIIFSVFLFRCHLDQNEIIFVAFKKAHMMKGKNKENRAFKFTQKWAFKLLLFSFVFPFDYILI